MTLGPILIVDDDAEMAAMLEEYFTSVGWETLRASSGEDALKLAAAQPPQVVVSDLRMGGMDGVELCRHLLAAHPDLPIVIMTAFGSIDKAIDAIKAGAQNFVTKPFKMGALRVLVERAIEARTLRLDHARLQRELGERNRLGNLVGGSRIMGEVYELIERVAPAACNVLVIGASGTGKELVARAIHWGGPRAQKPFVAINCASLPETLLESELFGHVKGAFTGAAGTKKGLVEAADGGTLFLDEIGDLQPMLQAKLLRVLEEREVRPVGAVAARPVDVRVIAATHRHLAHLVEQGEFREDLYFRLNVVSIRLPPLRERRDDIPALVEHFLKRHAGRLGRKPPEISPEALQRLTERPWRGNVRELENVIERALVLHDQDVLSPADVTPPADESLTSEGLQSFLIGRPTLGELEERYIDLVLHECDGDKTLAAQRLGVSTRTLYRREKR